MRTRSAFGLLVMALAMLAVPGTRLAAGAVPAPTYKVFPVVDAHGSVYGDVTVVNPANGQVIAAHARLITATGEGSGIGLSEIAAAGNVAGYKARTGWLASQYAMIDATPPVLVAPANVTAEQTVLAGTPVTIPWPQVSDAKDPDPSVTVTIGGVEEALPKPPATLVKTFPLGDTLVTYHATDRHHNRSVGVSIKVTVVDTTKPVMVATAQVQHEASSSAGTVVALPAPMVSDICDVAPTITNDAPARYPVGQTVVTWTATDHSGYKTTGTTTVKIVDTTAPTITFAQTTVSGECDVAPGLAGVPVQLPAPLLNDNASLPADITVTNNAPALFPFGETVVTFTAKDQANNTAQATVTVKVGDHEGPTVQPLQPPAGFSNQDVTLHFKVSDKCDHAPVVTVDPAPVALVRDAQDPTLYSATYSASGVYNVTIHAKDQANNETVTAGLVFGIEKTAPTITSDEITAPAPLNQPVNWPVYFKGEQFLGTFVASDGRGDDIAGMGQVVVTLVQLDLVNNIEMGRRPLLSKNYPPQGVPAVGPASDKTLACNSGQLCAAAGDLLLDKLDLGDYEIEAVVTDTAGNAATAKFPFHVFDLPKAIQLATQKINGLLAAGNLGAALPFVTDAGKLLGWAAAGNHTNAYLAASNDLLGNALLMLVDAIKLLQHAKTVNAAVDTAAEQNNLARGAYAATRGYWVTVLQGGNVGGDAATAQGFLQQADSGVANTNYLTAFVNLQNAFFYTQNYEAPLSVTQDFSEMQTDHLTDVLVTLLTDYVAQPTANATACVATALVHVQTARALIDDINGGGNINKDTINLMLELNYASDQLGSCIASPSYVWVRYWQWGLVQVVKAYVQRGRYAAGIELGCGMDVNLPGAEQCFDDNPLMGEAFCRYNDGIGYFNQRLVDNALNVYVLARCMMVALFNDAFFRDAIPVPAACQNAALFLYFDRDTGTCVPL